MARDIEEFLRRAAERRQQQLKQKHAKAPPRQQAPPPAPPSRPTRRLVIADDEVEIVRQRPIVKDMRDETVGGHVQRHIDTSALGDHASHLTDRIEQTDERLETRLHDKFDHRLGKLESKASVQDDIVPSVKGREASELANELIKMLSSPQSVRQAILIAEVLKRPDFE